MQPIRYLLTALLLFAGLLAAPTPARAAQSYDNCAGFIDTVPATITTQGTWCLRHDLTTAITTGAAITINNNNVTIDCNDFKLGGLQAGAATGTDGIVASSRLNATVRHCNIRGFLNGLVFQGVGGGHLVEDNRFDGNTAIGLYVVGDGSVVRRNRVSATGGSTLYTGYAYGIYAINGVDVIDNGVDGVAAKPDSNGNNTGYGIYTYANTSGSLIDNRVRGLVGAGAGLIYGIHNDAAGAISLRRNDVVGPGTSAIYCDNNIGSAKDNIMSGGFASGLVGCSDAGGNYTHP